jgi:hypothetical protein
MWRKRHWIYFGIPYNAIGIVSTFVTSVKEAADAEPSSNDSASAFTIFDIAGDVNHQRVSCCFYEDIRRSGAREQDQKREKSFF